MALPNVNLLILDECHHCMGKSDYAAIMETFYHLLPINQRPCILGLTALPLINFKNNHSDKQLAKQLAN